MIPLVKEAVLCTHPGCMLSNQLEVLGCQEDLAVLEVVMSTILDLMLDLVPECSQLISLECIVKVLGNHGAVSNLHVGLH